MKQLSVLFICLGFIFHATGQITFERDDSLEVGSTFCCPTTYYIIQTHDSGYLSAGFIVDGAVVNYFWEKLDSNGQSQWWKGFGYASGKVDLHSVDETPDHGFIICGNPRNSPFPIGVLKTDSDGVSEWERFIVVQNGDLYGYSAKQTMDSGYIIAGSKNAPGSWDAELIKLNSNGTIVWSKAYGVAMARDVFYDITETKDSGFVAVGATDSVNVFNQIFVVRTNSLGDTVWTRTFLDGLDCTEGISVTSTFDNGCVITGYPKDQGSPGKGSLLFKLDSLGNLLWEKKFGASDSLLVNSVKETRDSGLILSSNLVKLDRGNCLIKTNAQGDTLWSRLTNAGSYACESYDGGFAIAGGVNGKVVKTDSLGNTLCNSTSSGIEFIPSSLSLVSDSVVVIADTLMTVPLIYGNIGTHIVERNLCIPLNVQNVNSAAPVIELFPNPSSDKIRINSNVELTRFEIINPIGTLIRKSDLQNATTIEINLSGLSSSIYFIKLYSEEGFSTLKFLKDDLQN